LYNAARSLGATGENDVPEFEGIVPAIITPMTGDGEVDEEAFRVVMEDNIQAGVHGFWTAGGTGESVLLTDEENRRIARAAADQNQGRTNVIMHVGAQTTARAARNAEHAAAAGVEAICAVPPYFVHPGDQGVADYYRTVAAAADLPLFAYNLPQSTGVELTPDLMKRLQDQVPQLTGLKHSGYDMNNVYLFAKMGLRAFTGMGRLMLPALTVGAAGCVDGPPCLAPELWVAIWEAYNARDLDRAEEAQAKASAVMDFLIDLGYIGALKTAVGERLGIETGDPRPPNLGATPEQKVAAREAVHRLGLAKVAAVA
jgi:4-hydroxy-tetrahydrodipicolinate synthase